MTSAALPSVANTGRGWRTDALFWLLATLWIAINLRAHGMWLDELHAWCLVRDSASLSEFAHNARSEGHPWLWHLLLWPLAHAGAPAWSIQVLHGVIASATCALVLFTAPFPRWWRVLIVFGFFFVFEYAALSRNYAIGALLLFVLARTERERSGSWRSTLTLVLLANTHLWGTCVALAWMITSLLVDRDWSTARLLRSLIVVCACAVAFMCITPSDPVVYGPELSRLSDPEHMKRLGQLLTRVFLPFPDVSAAQPWSTSWFVRDDGPVGVWLGPLLLIGSWLLMPLSTRGRLLFAACTLAVLAFPAVAPFQTLRYGGPVWLLLIATCWAFPGTPLIGTLSVSRWWIGALLAVHVASAVAISMLLIQRPFSFSRSAVTSAEALGLQDLPAIVDRCDAGATISGYLGRKVYYPEREAWGSFCVWFPRPYDPTEEQVIAALTLNAQPRAILFAKDTLDAAVLERAGLRSQVISACTGGLLKREDHVVQLIEQMPSLR